jgi:pyridoxal phosphate enzyme (YggS family)
MSAEHTEVNVGANLEEVRQKIAECCQAAGRDVSTVQLVAVSKTKPLELVKQAYASGQRVFGENYAQELVDKAGSIGESDIKWHFIGGLQSNKANMLVKGVVPHGALVVETVSSLKVAKKLDNAISKFEDKKLEIFVQVNTSGEGSKSGVTPSEAVELCQQITKECERIQLKGVMTIGAPGDTDCLDSLSKCRDEVASALGVEPKELGLSMGMSNDYEVAIAKGSTNVRVGSTIFGARDYSDKKKASSFFANTSYFEIGVWLVDMFFKLVTN